MIPIPLDAIDLILREAEVVLPEVAALQVRVLLDLYVERGGREPSGIATEQPLGRKHDAVICFGISRIVDDIVQQALGPAVVLVVEPEKRVSVHRRRVVEVGVGEDEGHRSRIQSGPLGAEAAAGMLAELRGIELQLCSQPVVSSGKLALGMVTR